MWLVTSLSGRAISRKTSGQMELSLLGTHPGSPQMSFHNVSLIILLFQKPQILQHPPLPAIARGTCGAPLSIMVMLHGGFTWRMSTMIRKISKTKHILFVFFQSRYQCSNLLLLPNDHQAVVHGRRSVSIIVRTLISFTWFVFSYLNESSRDFILPYWYFLINRQWCYNC